MKAEPRIKEIRFRVENGLTIAYVLVESSSDNPIGEGWRSKAFPSNVSVREIVNEYLDDHLLWQRESPDA